MAALKGRHVQRLQSTRRREAAGGLAKLSDEATVRPGAPQPERKTAPRAFWGARGAGDGQPVADAQP